MYQVLARKWRPQNFDAVVGQKHVTATLANALNADRLAHAYIFAGLRGTGKTSIARILAKCLNCEQGPTTQPCGQCTSCTEVAESRSLDVLELDAASRTGVDNIRELQEVLSYAPVRDRYKILILDEFHMLSKSAFNALLKTLEEPPPKVLFILATTEIQKVLPTILSRCQVFELRRVSVRELAEHLRHICEEEKIEISGLALERIARAGEGSVRDSLSVLERVFAFSGKEIEDEDVLRLLGGVRSEVLSEIVHGMAEHDADKMLKVLDGLVDEGHDLIHFWSELVSALRDLMMLKIAPARTELLARTPEEAKALQQSAEDLSLEDLNRIFGIIADLEPALKSSAQPRFLFEASLIRLSSLGAIRPIEEVLSSFTAQPAGKPNPSPAHKMKEASDRPRKARRGSFGADLIAAVSKEKMMLGALLEAAASITAKSDGVAIVFAGEAAAARQLQRAENLKLIQDHAEKILGRKAGIRVQRGSAPESATGKKRSESGRRRTKKSGAVDDSLLERAKNEPGVKQLLHEFGAQVVEIRPLPAQQEERPGDDNDRNTEETT
jgi:DNA polymerase-3 subunit gamma/tau